MIAEVGSSAHPSESILLRVEGEVLSALRLCWLGRLGCERLRHARTVERDFAQTSDRLTRRSRVQILRRHRIGFFHACEPGDFGPGARAPSEAPGFRESPGRRTSQRGRSAALRRTASVEHGRDSIGHRVRMTSDGSV